MWQKAALAFLAGGIVAGTAVYIGLRDRTAAPPEPAPFVAASPAAAPPGAVPGPPPSTPAASAPESVSAAPAKPAEARKREPAVRPPARPVQKPAAPRPASEMAQARPQNDVIIVPPPVPAPPPEARPAPAAAEPAPEPKPTPEPSQTARPAPKREPRTVTIPAGTLIPVRLRDALSTERHSTDDSFVATLDAPLIVEGLVIAERGALVRGRIVEALEPGRVRGRAALTLQLVELNTSDGQKAEIRTESFRHEAESGVRSDVAKAGVAAGIGAALGAILGGGKGAAIGGAIGGAAGAGGAMATRGKHAELPSETRLTFRLSEPVTLTERLP
ncbi:MAG: hypothetical protein NZR01_08350 [Bryobacteraceae bacterium]|nr:hypothetical protein [Bryobacteraceae bacterium]